MVMVVLNPNLSSAVCCFAVIIPRFESLWRVLIAWWWKVPRLSKKEKKKKKKEQNFDNRKQNENDGLKDYLVGAIREFDSGK